MVSTPGMLAGMGAGLYLAEWYLPDGASRAPLGPLQHLSQLEPSVTVAWAIVIADDATALVLLRADGVDQALDALRRSGLPVDRITAVEAIAPPAQDEGGGPARR